MSPTPFGVGDFSMYMALAASSFVICQVLIRVKFAARFVQNNRHPNVSDGIVMQIIRILVSRIVRQLVTHIIYIIYIIYII
jgi:hypothetical protein